MEMRSDALPCWAEARANLRKKKVTIVPKFAGNEQIMQINLTENNPMGDPAIIEKLQGFFALQQQYGAAIKEVRTKLEVLDDEFRVKFDHNPIHHMEYRLKSPHSMVEKLRRRGLPVTIPSIRENLHDVAGVRVICNYIDDIYRIADLLVKQDDITLLCTKDYIANPKPNGYRSLHLVIEIPIFLLEQRLLMPVEVQIRTIAMDFWASLEHQLKYKAATQVPDDVREELYQCAIAIADIDERMQNICRKLRGQCEVEKDSTSPAT